MHPSIHLIDDTWIEAPPESVAVEVRRQQNWDRWWPDLTLAVLRDRGEKGMRWTVTGPLVGTAEIWLEPFDDGVILHHFLRLDPGPGATSTSRRGLRRVELQLAWHAKRVFWALKDELERGRR